MNVLILDRSGLAQQPPPPRIVVISAEDLETNEQPHAASPKGLSFGG